MPISPHPQPSSSKSRNVLCLQKVKIDFDFFLSELMKADSEKNGSKTLLKVKLF